MEFVEPGLWILGCGAFVDPGLWSLSGACLEPGL